ncbi:hypothetical protein C8J56DRAFT_1048267 [Mycena floridula]|nr:hypothetical protein C8J56DRAFT_1048267 [Mycena floridula]
MIVSRILRNSGSISQPLYETHVGIVIPIGLIQALRIAEGESTTLLPKLTEFATFIRSNQTSALKEMAVSRLEAGKAGKVDLLAKDVAATIQYEPVPGILRATRKSQQKDGLFTLLTVYPVVYDDSVMLAEWPAAFLKQPFAAFVGSYYRFS